MANGKLFIEEIKEMLEEEKPLPPRQATRLLLVGMVDVYNVAKEISAKITELDEKKVQPLEKWKSNINGRIWALTIGIPIVMSLLVLLITHLLGG